MLGGSFGGGIRFLLSRMVLRGRAWLRRFGCPIRLSRFLGFVSMAMLLLLLLLLEICTYHALGAFGGHPRPQALADYGTQRSG